MSETRPGRASNWGAANIKLPCERGATTTFVPIAEEAFAGVDLRHEEGIIQALDRTQEELIGPGGVNIGGAKKDQDVLIAIVGGVLEKGVEVAIRSRDGLELPSKAHGTILPIEDRLYLHGEIEREMPQVSAMACKLGILPSEEFPRGNFDEESFTKR